MYACLHITQVKVEERTIWQNYRPLKKPEPEAIDPHAAGPFLEKIAMTCIGVGVLTMLADDLLRIIFDLLRFGIF